MKKYIEPIDGRKSFYGKCYVIEEGNRATLYSYGTVVVEIDTKTREIVKKYKAYDYSATTRRHQRAFFAAYGIR